MYSFLPFNKEDVGELLRWVDSKKLLYQWSGSRFAYPMEEDVFLKHFAASIGDQPERYLFKVNDDDEMVGYIELNNVNIAHRNAMISRVLVKPTKQNKGVASFMMKELLKVAFEELGVHRVSLNVFDFNDPARNVYDKIGFKKEGYLRDTLKCDDEYWSIYVMSMLEHEYKDAYRM